MKEPAQRYQSAGELGAALQMIPPATADSIRGILGNKVSQRLIVALVTLFTAHGRRLRCYRPQQERGTAGTDGGGTSV